MTDIQQAQMSPRLLHNRLKRGYCRLNEDGEVEKQCPRCGEYWPADSEFFYHKSRAVDGLDSWCKACQAENDSRKNSRNQYKRKPKYTAPDW